MMHAEFSVQVPTYDMSCTVQKLARGEEQANRISYTIAVGITYLVRTEFAYDLGRASPGRLYHTRIIHL